jgi:metal-responsive CopG/Arc/MetJ family transcriptional regulator
MKMKARKQTENLVRKTLRLNPKKVEELCEIYEAKTESEAIRRAIEEKLAYNSMLETARRIQRRGTFGTF